MSKRRRDNFGADDDDLSMEFGLAGAQSINDLVWDDDVNFFEQNAMEPPPNVPPRIPARLVPLPPPPPPAPELPDVNIPDVVANYVGEMPDWLDEELPMPSVDSLATPEGVEDMIKTLIDEAVSCLLAGTDIRRLHPARVH